jgi:hypothetical protein
MEKIVASLDEEALPFDTSAIEHRGRTRMADENSPRE